MKINLIACIAQDGGIGYENHLLFHIKEDMDRFRMLTTGNTIIMGRKTYDSLPNGALSNRHNIVISHQDLLLKGCETYPSLKDAIDHCQDDNIFVIGGASIYEQALPYATTLYLTQVEETKEADTFFPPINLDEWKTTSSIKRKRKLRDTKETISFYFLTLEKIN